MLGKAASDGHAPESGLSLPLAMPAGRTREPSTLDRSRAMDHFLAEVEGRALRMAVYAVGDRDEALDIVQDAMIRLVRGYGHRPDEEWRPLFFRILTNRITDHQRRAVVRRRVLTWLRPADEGDGEDPLAQVADPVNPGPDGRAEQDAALVALEAAVQSLPARQREAFLLRSLEGLDVAATAEAMGCTEGSVKTHYFRAVQSLRRTLGEHWS